MRTCKEKTDVSKSHAGPLICSVRVNRAECGEAALDVNSKHKRSQGPLSPTVGLLHSCQGGDFRWRLYLALLLWKGLAVAPPPKERSEGPLPSHLISHHLLPAPQDLPVQTGRPVGGGSLLGAALPPRMPFLPPTAKCYSSCVLSLLPYLLLANNRSGFNDTSGVSRRGPVVPSKWSPDQQWQHLPGACRKANSQAPLQICGVRNCVVGARHLMIPQAL